MTVSRPGYGRTAVGLLTAAQFVAPLCDALHQLGVESLAAVVGVSFGGLQAVESARHGSPKPQRLILASAAPSSLPYPDSVRDRVMGPVVFAPALERATWAMVRRLVGSERGLRLLAGSLSRLPAAAWWPQWTEADKERCRALFVGMSSGSGFVSDLRQATGKQSSARRASLAAVEVPTLVLASRHDAGVGFAHAEDEARTIPDARLVETNAASPLFWLGATRGQVVDALRQFLSGPCP